MEDTGAITRPSFHGKSQPSGFSFLDAEMGGFWPARRYLFLCTPGVSRDAAVLQVAKAGADQGEVVLILTAEDPDALLVRSELLEMQLAGHMRGGRIALLGFDKQFAETVSNPALQDLLLKDLDRKVGTDRVNRVLFVDESAASRNNIKIRQVMERLEHVLVEERKAVMLHFLDDSDDTYLQERKKSSFGVFQLDALDQIDPGQLTFRVIKEPHILRPRAEFVARIEPNTGLVAVDAKATIRVVYVSDEATKATDLAACLGEAYDLRIRTTAQARELLKTDHPAVVVIEDPIGNNRMRVVSLVEDLRNNTDAAMLICTPHVKRMNDRIFLLRAGVDEVLDPDIPVGEVRERIHRHAVRLNLATTLKTIRQDIGAELPKSGELGTVPWGLFEADLEKLVDRLDKRGGLFALIRIEVRNTTKEAGDTQPVTRAIATLVRNDDPYSIDPSGAIVIRLFGLSKNEIGKTLKRYQENVYLENADGVEVVATHALYPTDSRSPKNLLAVLRRPERERALYFQTIAARQQVSA